MPYSPGNAKVGAALFKRRCAGCHAIEPGDRSPTPEAPTLNGVIGRTAKRFIITSTTSRTETIVWGEDTLFEYLKDPNAYIPGTKMVFEGLTKEKDRNDLITFIKERNEKNKK
ncbi:cytochrome c-like domain-containing protein [Rhizoctonia solani]|nr:cytochrome c-like domain-containing protein [Rhizoctonia solani]